MLAEGTLSHNTLVATVMSNMGLDIALRRAVVRLLRQRLVTVMLSRRCSKKVTTWRRTVRSHDLFDHNTTGDGVLSALQTLAIMQRTGKPLSQLAEVMTALPQLLVNVRVKEKVDLATVPAGPAGD